MLVRITNKCRMNCSHCMINADENGDHMTEDTFHKTVEFCKEHDPLFLMISGGEPVEHPQFFDFVEYAKKQDFKAVLVMSNGMFADDDELCKKVLALDVPIQITNDPRFYPQKVKRITHENVSYEEQIRLVSPFGRAVENNLEISKQYPLCINLRLITVQLSLPMLPQGKMAKLKDVLFQLRMAQKFCTPSVDANGNVRAGESSECQKLGTVWDSEDTILRNITADCNKCGLYDNLMKGVDPSKIIRVSR